MSTVLFKGPRKCKKRVIVSTRDGCFGLAFTTLPPPLPVEIVSVSALRGNLHQLGSPNLQDIFIGR